MLSSVYQQASDGGTRNAEVGVGKPAVRSKPRTAIANPQLIDPENRLLWRMNRRRLDFEAMRDSFLAASGQLDRLMGGPPVDLLASPYSKRRSVYAFIDRQNLPGLFRVFDFANPDAHSPGRFNTTVPQQALFLMNSPFVIEQARQVASRQEVTQAAEAGGKVKALYELIFGRDAMDREIARGVAFIQIESAEEKPAESAGKALNAWERYAQALLLSNEFMFFD
jgi:hypothetical protein